MRRQTGCWYSIRLRPVDGKLASQMEVEINAFQLLCLEFKRTGHTDNQVLYGKHCFKDTNYKHLRNAGYLRFVYEILFPDLTEHAQAILNDFGCIVLKTNISKKDRLNNYLTLPYEKS